MLHTTSGIEATLGLLKEAGIATRKWHLGRRLEKEGEEEEVRHSLFYFFPLSCLGLGPQYPLE